MTPGMKQNNNWTIPISQSLEEIKPCDKPALVKRTSLSTLSVGQPPLGGGGGGGERGGGILGSWIAGPFLPPSVLFVTPTL